MHAVSAVTSHLITPQEVQEAFNQKLGVEPNPNAVFFFSKDTIILRN